MGDDWLSTSPFAAPVHWTAAYLPLDPPLSLEAGDSVSFRIDREPHGDWTWAVETPRDQQRHSTLLSEPLDADSLLKARPDHLPSLSRDGEAVREVLSAFDGTRSAHDIADGLTMRFPGRFPSRREALAFVQRLVKRHA